MRRPGISVPKERCGQSVGEVGWPAVTEAGRVAGGAEGSGSGPPWGCARLCHLLVTCPWVSSSIQL